MGSWGVVPFALSALLTAFCALFVWQRRSQPGARAFAMTLAMETLWSTGYTFELASQSLEGKLFWDDVRLLAMVAMMPFTLLFLWDYEGKAPRRRGTVLAAYMVLPTLALLWVVSDPLHGEARASAHIESAPPFDALIYDFSTLELLFFLQCYATLVYVSVKLARVAARQHRAHGLQLALVVGGMLFPCAASTAGILGLRPFGQRDMAPACFGIAALMITWAMFRRRFFDLVPVARHVVFGQLPDPVLVLDPAERIVELNPCAQRLLNNRTDAVGMSLAQLLPAQTADKLGQVREGAMVEVELGERTFEARSEPLEERAGQGRGRVVLLREVTARKAAERALTSAHEALELRVQQPCGHCPHRAARWTSW